MKQSITNSAPSSLVFAFEGQDIRTVLIDRELWFLAKDVAEALGYSDTFKMTARLDEDERQNLQISGFGNRGVTVISEAGVYEAIFGSQKAKAKDFKRWLKTEVLPSIRKRGMFIEGQQKIRAELLDALAENIREKALPALREFDRLTEHDHWLALKNPERHKRSIQIAIDRVALDFDLPRSLVTALTVGGLSIVTDL